jgi:hypothetical protein
MQTIPANINSTEMQTCELSAGPASGLQPGPTAQPESQEQLRQWLEALGGQIQQLGVDAGSLRNRLASMQGTYISGSTSLTRTHKGPGEDQHFANLVLRLLQKVQ